MKNTALTALIVIGLIGTGGTQVFQSRPDAPLEAPHLTRKHAMRLLTTARTPEEHRALAQYYRQEAQQKRGKEQHYLEIEATYRLHPPRVDAYRNSSTADYYRHLAEEARELAVADERLAVFQDELARDLAATK